MQKSTVDSLEFAREKRLKLSSTTRPVVKRAKHCYSWIDVREAFSTLFTRRSAVFLAALMT